MANPTPYDPTYEYGGATNIIPGDQLDNDFAKLKVTTDQIIAALGDVRRSDGKLNNGVVDADSLDPDFKQDLYNEFTEGAAGLVDEAEQARDEAVQAKLDAEAAASAADNSKIAAANSASAAAVSASAAEQAKNDTQALLDNLDASDVTVTPPSPLTSTDVQGLFDEVLANLVWLSMPLGVPFPIWDQFGTAVIPPMTDPRFRYIRLSASDSYNDGVLTSESVSGSSPNITATAVINMPSSPLHGLTVPLINTEQTIVRPRGTTGGTLQAGEVGPHTHPAPFSDSRAWRGTGPSDIFGGGAVFDLYSTQQNTGTETRMRNRSARYYMRIF